MRRRGAVIAALFLLFAACGGDDDDDAVDVGLTRDEAEDAVERVLLDENDLGDGWDQTGTVAPDEESEPPDLVESCLGASVLRALDAAELAVSERRDFERSGDEQFASTRVSVRTFAFDEATAVDSITALFVDDAFTDCLGQRFEPLLDDGKSELGLQVGEPEVDETYLALDGVRSSHLSIPFHADAPGFSFDAELDLVVVSRDQLASLLQTIELRGVVDGEDVARWAALLADRQRIAQSDAT